MHSRREGLHLLFSEVPTKCSVQPDNLTTWFVMLVNLGTSSSIELLTI